MRISFRDGSYKKSELYKGVYSGSINKLSSGQKSSGIIFWAKIEVKGQQYYSKMYKTEREAALWYDKKRIEHGLEPINIGHRLLNIIGNESW